MTDYSASPNAKLKPRWRAPSWGMIALALILIAAFCSAGFWQLSRAQFKVQQATMLAQALQKPHKQIFGELDQSKGSVQRVKISGRYLDTPIVLLDNQIVDGKAGVQVFQLFQVNDSKPLLINRGWLPRLLDRSVAIAVPEVSHDFVMLQGLALDPPSIGVRLGEHQIDASAKQVLLTYIDTDQISAALKTSLQTKTLMLDAEANSEFVREWRQGGIDADKHRGYALQWFSFAAALVVIFIVLHRPVLVNKSESV